MQELPNFEIGDFENIFEQKELNEEKELNDEMELDEIEEDIRATKRK